MAPFGAGSQTGSAVAAGSVLDGTGLDALAAAPGAGDGSAFVVALGGAPPAPAVAPSASAAPTKAKPAAKPAAHKKKPKLPLCPRKKPKPKYKLVKGKRVKLKPRHCRPRPRTKTNTKARGRPGTHWARRHLAAPSEGPAIAGRHDRVVRS
ncbi:MAG: hypothetical protein M3Q31_12640, partial [Actinomycetota bacterium]|nr:hypothetical protein [Actinomycetota bacterium]